MLRIPFWLDAVDVPALEFFGGLLLATAVAADPTVGEALGQVEGGVLAGAGVDLELVLGHGGF